MAHKVIPDPYIGDNLLKIGWVEQEDWTYSCSFNVDKESDIFNKKQINLVFEGLDTNANIILNDIQIGEVHNMFRTWSFDVKHLLKEYNNTLII
jgi:beta-mannosidase